MRRERTPRIKSLENLMHALSPIALARLAVRGASTLASALALASPLAAVVSVAVGSVAVVSVAVGSPANAAMLPAAGESALPEQAAPSIAVLRFDPPTLDLGEMLAGQRKTAVLTVTNVGDAPVAIASMKGGCGCTTLGEYPQDTLPPGASFHVDVTVDPGMRTGIGLRKPVHVVLADGRVETMYVVGTVKTIIAVSPEQLEAVGSVVGVDVSVTLASVDGSLFRITGVEPAGILALAHADIASSRFELEIDLEAWESAGRPANITIQTDRPDARELAIPVKFADAVAMFRLPAAELGRKGQEALQDSLLHEIDARIGESARSSQFRMRLHRESGMLFVHGTIGDLELVRAAVRSLPPSSGVRESVAPPKG
jgi:hypothetical protein